MKKKPHTPADSGARASLATTEKRRAHIQALMTAGEWSRGRTGRELAKEWGLSASAVRNLAAEVSKALGWAPGREEREAVTADLDEATDLIREGLESGDDKRAQLHVKAGAALATIARQRAEVLGLRGPVAPEAAPSTRDAVPFGFERVPAPKPPEQPS